MNILVTGASGFVGSHVVEVLDELGIRTTLLAGREPNPRRLDGRFPDQRRFTVDLNDQLSVREIVREARPTTCIHTAWFASPGEYLSSHQNIGMVSATVNLAIELAEVGCDRLVSVGSVFEYDMSYGFLSEDKTPIVPSSAYSAAKTSAFSLMSQITKDLNISVAWARLFYLYGPYEDRRRLVPSVVGSLLAGRESKMTGGKQIRDYLHVKDAARALVAIAIADVEGAVNVGSGKADTIREIVEMIGLKTGRSDLLRLGSIPYRDGEPPMIVADNMKLLAETDWSPDYDLSTGIGATVDWWKQNLDWRV